MKKIVASMILCLMMVMLIFPVQAQNAEALVYEPMSTFDVCPYNALVVDSDGRLWGWGKNVHNALRTHAKEVLSPIIVFDSVKSASTGSSFVLAVRQDDTLWGWGWNFHGQLGLGTNNEVENVPIKIMDDVTAAYAGSALSFVLKKDGSLWAAGHNFYGELGNGTRTYQEPYDAGNGVTRYRWVDNDSNIFIKVMDNIRSVHIDSGTIIAVDYDNCLWAWGRNCVEIGGVINGVVDVYGLIADDAEQFSVNTPQKLMEGVRSACATSDHLYILTLDGKLIEWKSPKSQKTLLYNVKYVDASEFTVAAITSDDSLICWGLPNTGQGNKDYCKVAENVAYAAVSSRFVGYIDRQGNLYTAGRNYEGQIGNGEKPPPLPPPIPDAGYPFIESDYIYPPVKVLSNAAYPELPSASIQYDMRINGATVYFDTPPMTKQGEVFVPLRAFLETYGMDVTWDNTERAAKAANEDMTIILRNNSNIAYINSSSVTLKNAATIVNGRTMIGAEDLAAILKMTATVSNDGKAITLDGGKDR